MTTYAHSNRNGNIKFCDVKRKTAFDVERIFQNIQTKRIFGEEQNGEMYSARSIQEILKLAKSKAGIKKKLLGHQSLRTTMIYTHVSKEHISKIQSPLDKITLKINAV